MHSLPIGTEVCSVSDRRAGDVIFGVFLFLGGDDVVFVGFHLCKLLQGPLQGGQVASPRLEARHRPPDAKDPGVCDALHHDDALPVAVWYVWQ
jgi:hypothetical protein